MKARAPSAIFLDIVLNRRFRLVVLHCVLWAIGFGSTLVAQSPPTRPVRPPGSSSIQCGTQSSNQVASGVAMASWVARVEPDGTRSLALLVLWRGSPGWFTRGSGSGSSSSGNCRVYRSTIRNGDLQLQIEFDSQTRLAYLSKPVRFTTGLAPSEKADRPASTRSRVRVD